MSSTPTATPIPMPAFAGVERPSLLLLLSLPLGDVVLVPPAALDGSLASAGEPEDVRLEEGGVGDGELVLSVPVDLEEELLRDDGELDGVEFEEALAVASLVPHLLWMLSLQLCWPDASLALLLTHWLKASLQMSCVRKSAPPQAQGRAKLTEGNEFLYCSN